MKMPFQKLSAIVTHKKLDAFMSALQELGVLHIDASEAEDPQELEAIHYRKNQLEQVVQTIKRTRKPTLQKKKTRVESQSTQAVVDQVLQLENKIEHLEQQIELNYKDWEKIHFWGDFEHEDFRKLINKGYQVRLASATKKDFPGLDFSGLYLKKVATSRHDLFFLIIAKQDKSIDLPIDHFEIPPKGPQQLLAEISRDKHKIKQIKKELRAYRPNLSQLRKEIVDVNNSLLLVRAKGASHEIRKQLILLEGWVPEDRTEVITKLLKDQGVTFQLREPLETEEPPVALVNNPYSRLFEPITKVFELPNYYEMDLTPFIAVFYPILFAYCLGDAGYGLVLSAIMLGGYFSFFKDQKQAAVLGVLLGLFTTVMGLIKSGSLFGIILLEDHSSPIVSYLARFVIIPDDSDFLFNAFNVALMIGVVQIVTGVLISIFNKIYYEKSLTALSAIGKLMIILSLLWIFLADMQQIEALEVFGALRSITLIIGIVLVAGFHEVGTPLIQRALSSVMPLFFIFTGILGDILSYVRLFALGLASSVLGLVVNQIGEQIMSGGTLSLIIGLLFLLFGHTLNFGIAALGSFVHPLRLTFVEFYGNANFSGKGINYKPFKKTDQSFIKT